MVDGFKHTFESRHDIQAVFLLIRACGEDCSAAEARRSRDSRDSPLSIIGVMDAMRLIMVCPSRRGLPTRIRCVRCLDLVGGESALGSGVIFCA